MSRDLEEAVRRWLAEESAGSDAGAEEALAAAFAALPAPTPPAGFAERVLLAAGVTPAPTAERPLVRVWRLGGIAALLLAGLAAAFLPMTLVALGPPVGLNSGVEALAALVLGACRALVEALSFWELLASVGEAISVLVSKPPLLAAAAAALMASAAALVALYRLLLSDERSPHHVQ